MKIDKLQLYRNGVYFASKEEAIATLEAAKTTALDGEIMLARYRTDEAKVETLIAVVAKLDESDAYVTIYDLESLKDSIVSDALRGVSFNGVDGEIDEEDKTVKLVIAAKDINVSADYITIKYEELSGVVFDSVQENDTIEEALMKVESNFTKLIDNLIDNELVVAKALTTLNESVGLEPDGTYRVLTSNPILSAATTLYGADVELSQAIVDNKLQLEEKIQEVADIVEVMANEVPFQSSDLILLTEVTDEDGNVIAKQFELTEELNLIVESEYENM